VVAARAQASRPLPQAAAAYIYFISLISCVLHGPWAWGLGPGLWTVACRMRLALPSCRMRMRLGPLAVAVTLSRVTLPHFCHLRLRGSASALWLMAYYLAYGLLWLVMSCELL
jgi:hypothetical protein